MYSNLSLYYLNHLGIRPWVRRMTHEIKHDVRKLMVFTSSTLSSKGTTLLTQMMAYLNLDENDLNIIAMQETDSFAHYLAQGSAQSPQAVLILGLNAHQGREQLMHDCPVLNSFDLDYLIAHPAEKSKAFRDIHHLKQLIS